MKAEFSVVLEKYGTGDFDNYRIPVIAVTRSGTIVTAYESRRGPLGDWAEIWITLRRSTDGGRTFEEPYYPHKRLEEEYGESAVTWNNPVLIADDEKLHLIFHQEYVRAWYCYSVDDGKSFTIPVEITTAFQQFTKEWNVCASGPCHGIVSDDGRLVVPIWLALGKERLDVDPSGRAKRHQPSSAGCIFSEDRGATWKAGFVTKGIENANETSVVQLKNGKFLLNFRNTRFEKCRVMGIVRSDLMVLERAWSEMSLPDPACCGSMVRVGDVIYFVNCADTVSRVNLTLSESRDEGNTWGSILLVDEAGGYADIAADSMGLYIFYEGEVEGTKALIIKKYLW